MTILVTGASGLVGARLLPRLVEAGHACVALVRAGKPVPKRATAAYGDLLDPASLAGAVKGVTAIIHLAAVFRTQDSDLVWRSNLDGTSNLIAAAKENAPEARFIMASTGLVYDMDSPHPGREEDAAHPTLAYPASKLAAETELRQSGLNWSILRLAFVYGDKDGHLESLPKLARAAHWHPAQKLSMVHHRDIATAMDLALAGAADQRIVNLADDAPTSVYELCALQGDRIEPSAAPLTNPWYIHIDASLARSLGFRPRVRSIYHALEENLM
jgi:UDP-glucose 4-epimerase